MSKEYLEELKVLQGERMNTPVEDSNEVITLYHGTASKYLNDILENGLRPRRYHNNSNFGEGTNPSNDSLVYLSPVLQYFYAFMGVINNKDAYEEEHGELSYEEYYERTGDVPIIIKVEVPVSWLTYDEDVAYFSKFRADYAENPTKTLAELDYKYSLLQHSCASMKTIPFERIKSIQGIAYYDLNITCKGQSTYGNMIENWRFGLELPLEQFEGAVEQLLYEMNDNHLGAFEEIQPTKGERYKIRFEDYALFIELAETTKI